MFSRSPDFKSIFTTVFASAADELGHRTRVKLFRLAFEAAVPLFAGRAQLYEAYARASRPGSPVPAAAYTTKTPRPTRSSQCSTMSRHASANAARRWRRRARKTWRNAGG
jgi:aromatic ring hydroxylase